MQRGDTINVLDHGYVKLVDHMGSDESIIEAARMSTGKGFLGWGATCVECGWAEGEDHEAGCSRPDRWKAGDEKLLGYLYENAHHTPFEMVQLVIEAQAPIFVLRQWHRHRVPFSYNEFSGRYATLPDLYYVPARERVRAKGKANKQGSEGTLPDTVVDAFLGGVREGQTTAREEYEAVLKLGVASELARINLPVSQYTRHRVSANLRGWFAFLKLRQDPHAQEEIRVYADAIAQVIAQLWPRSFALYEEHTRRAVTLSASEAEVVRRLAAGAALPPGLAKKLGAGT